MLWISRVSHNRAESFLLSCCIRVSCCFAFGGVLLVLVKKKSFFLFHLPLVVRVLAVAVAVAVAVYFGAGSLSLLLMLCFYPSVARPRRERF